MDNKRQPQVGIVMGSDSDLGVMEETAAILRKFDVPFEMTVASAHRSPQRAAEFASRAKDRGIKVIIAAAGHAAHLAGAMAALIGMIFGIPSLRFNTESGVSLDEGVNGGLLAGASYRVSDSLRIGPGSWAPP